MTVILAIDDDPGILRLLRLELSTQGYEVITARNEEEGLRLLDSREPEVVILDILLPGSSGLDVLTQVRARSQVPVILLTARASEKTRLEALALGADDFIAKPFQPDHVSASVELLLAKGRGAIAADNVLKSGALEIDLHHRLLRRGGELIRLNRSEWRLIEELARTPGEPRFYQELLSNVWGPEYRDDLDYLRLWIKRLRAKLGDDPGAPRTILPYLDIGFTLNINR